VTEHSRKSCNDGRRGAVRIIHFHDSEDQSTKQPDWIRPLAILGVESYGTWWIRNVRILHTPEKVLLIDNALTWESNYSPKSVLGRTPNFERPAHPNGAFGTGHFRKRPFQIRYHQLFSHFQWRKPEIKYCKKQLQSLLYCYQLQPPSPPPLIFFSASHL